MYDPEFYENRVFNCAGDMRKAVWHASEEDYKRVKEESTTICHQYFTEGMRVLDAGCGIGELIECLPAGVSYVGIDFTRSFIDAARELYPDHRFHLVDLTWNLPFKDNEFDAVVCRHMQGVLNGMGDLSTKVYKELLRIAPYVLKIRAGDKPGDTLNSVEIVKSCPS